MKTARVSFSEFFEFIAYRGGKIFLIFTFHPQVYGTSSAVHSKLLLMSHITIKIIIIMQYSHRTFINILIIIYVHEEGQSPL